MNTINYCDFNIICRICLTKGGITFTSDTVILNIFHKLTDLDFQTDDLPQQICQTCFNKINEICEFSFQCKQSHSALIECLNQQKNPEPIKVEGEITTNSDIFESLDRLNTEEVKEEILDLEPDVIYDEDEGEEETTTNSEIIDSLDELKTVELQLNILVPNVKEEATNNKIIVSENKISVNNDERSYKYGKYSKVFLKKSHLIQHERIHKSNHPYKCIQCSRVFIDKPQLMQHKCIHSGERPYKCSQCFKSFTQHSTLRQHKRIHSGERPYKCDQCSKTFSRQSHLVQHKQIHSAERPYKCDQCTKTFKRPSCLSKHKQVHSDERPHKCDQCSKTFSYIYCLHRHIKTHK